MCMPAELHRPWSLVEIFCTEDEPWEYVLKNDFGYFDTSELHRLCRDVETRILARCAGLIEITDRRPHGLIYVSDERGHRATPPISIDNPPYILREVEFIHRTVVEFLCGNHEFFQEPNWRKDTCMTRLRGQLGLLSAIPFGLRKYYATEGVIGTDNLIVGITYTLAVHDDLIPASERNLVPVDEVQMVDHVYQIIGQVDATLNPSTFSLV